MKHYYQLLCHTLALSLCASQLFAQKSYLKPPGSGLQAWHPIKKWRGLDLQAYLWGTGYFGGPGNTATGTYALISNTSGGYNTADGYGALQYNTTGTKNSAVGFSALQNLTTASFNTAVGAYVLQSNNGEANTGVGFSVLSSNSTGCCNVGLGANSLYESTGSNNTAVGYASLELATTESNSVALGYLCMYNSNSSSGHNTAAGSYALYGAGGGNSGSFNTAYGGNAMYNNEFGSLNVAAGYDAMYTSSTGGSDVANGTFAMYYTTQGSFDVANGNSALYNNTFGCYNVGDGCEALYSNIGGSMNTGVGYGADVTTGNLSNAMVFGAYANASASNSVMVGNSSVTSIGGYANWSNFSDGRYKKNIQQNVPGLAFINKLTPITYTLDIDGIETKLHAGDKAPSIKNNPGKPSYLDNPTMKQAMKEKSAITYTGFVAQDVEKAADSVGFTFSGIDKPKDANQSFYGLRYGDFVVPLVKAVQELSAGSNSKDSAINVLQNKYDSLQTQVNELRALVLAKNTSAMSGASLDQNAPNPFTGSTVIGYSLPKGTSSAKLQITDINGNVLGIIPLSGSAGKSTVTASLSGYAAGTYMYSLIVNGQLVGTKQMTAIR